jgi:curved DNA-binding protein CbpA
MVGVAEQDHYATLGVDVNASFAKIKHAYRQLIRMSHPDKFANAPASVHLGAEERTKCLNGANEVLSDPVTRAAYDRTRLQHIKMQPAQASKSTSQDAWPQASTYTSRPKPPHNSCFDHSYIPQVIPHPSDFDIMSEEFARSPPWTPKRPESRKRSEPPKRHVPPNRDSKDEKSEHDDLPKRDNDLPKCEPLSPDKDSRKMPLTLESLHIQQRIPHLKLAVRTCCPTRTIKESRTESWATQAIQSSHLALCHSIGHLALGRVLLRTNRRC